MKINNVSTIRADDFSEDDKRVAEQIGNILNPFMQQVAELADKRVDFENRVENLKVIEMTVDATGTPILNNKIQTDKSNIRGFQVIAAFHVSDPSIIPTAQPFIVYTPIGGGLVQISKILGIPANQKFRLTIIIY